MGHDKNLPFYKKKSLSRITLFLEEIPKKMKTPLHFSRQDESKHVGDLE